MSITAKTKINIIIGDPVEHSMSPAMHNAAYKALGIDDQFVFIASRVKPEKLETVINALRVMNMHGITCTIPHKIEIMKYVDEIDEVALQIGAVNSVVNERGKLKGYNTDWLGIVTPLEKRGSLKNKKVALIGAGGAAHAMGYGVLSKGAELTIFNRTLEKAKELALFLKEKNLGKVLAKSIDHISELADFDIILNATNLGMGEYVDKTPVPKEFIQKHHIVFDAVYIPAETKLLREAKEKGATVMYGWEMLLHQGMPQFKLYTGHKAPEDVMEHVLTKKI